MTSTDGLPTIKTYSGVWIDFSDPKPGMIRLFDIAHALSQVCRFGGQCDPFYSVAQHSLLVSDLVLEPHEAWGLLHDASEAYIGDMVSPLKRLLPSYREIEDRMMKAIAERFGLDPAMPGEVKIADRLALAIEGRRLMQGRDDEYGVAELDPMMVRLAENFDVLTSHDAESRFLWKAKKLGLKE